MITFTTGNLLESDAEALVNTVNTVGVMGKGVALMFKEAFPENFEAYERACALKEVRIGKMFVTEREKLFGPKWIINFPTKAHWRFPSKIEWIVEGLDDLKQVIAETGDRIAAIRLIRERFGLDLVQAKEVMLQAEGTARSLAEHEEHRVGFGT